MDHSRHDSPQRFSFLVNRERNLSGLRPSEKDGFLEAESWARAWLETRAYALSTERFARRFAQRLTTRGSKDCERAAVEVLEEMLDEQNDEELSDVALLRSPDRAYYVAVAHGLALHPRLARLLCVAVNRLSTPARRRARTELLPVDGAGPALRTRSWVKQTERAEPQERSGPSSSRPQPPPRT